MVLSSASLNKFTLNKNNCSKLSKTYQFTYLIKLYLPWQQITNKYQQEVLTGF